MAVVKNNAISQVDINIKNAKELVEAQSHISETMVLWMDLLGFRGDIDKENWDVNSRKVVFAMERIAAFHEVALTSMDQNHEIVQLNDALVIGRDLGKDPKTEIEEFLALVDYCFEVSALTDRKIGGKGVRGVIAKGIRYSLRGNLGWLRGSDLKSPSFFCPRPIMMNTAFGRAYGVESSGYLKKCSALYVDKSLLDYQSRIMETWNINNIFDVEKFGKFLLVREYN